MSGVVLGNRMQREDNRKMFELSWPPEEVGKFVSNRLHWEGSSERVERVERKKQILDLPEELCDKERWWCATMLGRQEGE